MTALVFVVVALVAVVGAGGLIAALVALLRAGERQRRRRVAEQSAYAAARGFAYTELDRALPDRFTGAPFGRGTGRYAQHVLQGTHAGRPVVAFDYWFATGGGDRRHRHVCGVLATALPTAVPELELVRSSTFGTFVDAVRGGDHQLGDPAFDAAYRVFTTSAPFAADVLTPALRAWLLAQHPPLVRLRDGDLVVVDTGALSPAEIDRRLAFAAAFLDRVPGEVWARAAGGRAG